MNENRVRITFKENVHRDLFLKKESLKNDKDVIIDVTCNKSFFHYALSLKEDGMIQNQSITALKEKIKKYTLKDKCMKINQLGYAILNDSDLLRKQLGEEIQLLQNNRYAKYRGINHITLEDVYLKVDNEFIEIKEEVYSYHTFMFPFRLCGNKALLKDLFPKANQSGIFEKYSTKQIIEHICKSSENKYWFKNQMSNDAITTLHDFSENESSDKWNAYTDDEIRNLYISHYNRIQYFNDAPLKAIYDMPDSANENSVSDISSQYIFRYHAQRRKMEMLVGIPEESSENKSKMYRMFLNNIRLKAYNTDVAILIFEVENRQYEDLEDVKKISAFTRRVALANLNIGANIAPIFWNIKIYDENNVDEEQGISNLMKSDIWNSFESVLNRSSNPLLRQQLERINYKKIVDPIKNLIGICCENWDVTSNKLKFENSEDSLLLIEPIIDDRMFVCAYVLDNDLLSSASKKYYAKDDVYLPCEENKDYTGYSIKYGYQTNYQAAKKIYEIAYVDESFCTCQSEHMIQRLLDESLYTRWIDYQTIQACTHHSFIEMSSKFCPQYLIDTFLELYTELACLVLCQRSSILQFQLFATCLTAELEKSTNKLTQKKINQLLRLQERYIAFQNQLMLFEVSPQEQAVDLYMMLGNALYINEEKSKFREQLQCLYEATNVNQDSNFNLYATLFAVWTIILAAFTFVYDSLSSGENIMNDYFVKIKLSFSWELLSIFMIVIAISILTIMSYKIFKHYEKN